MKQVTSLRYIYKIDSKKLAKNDWTIDIDNKNKKELIKTRELIGLADNQGFRFIKEIAKIKDKDEELKFRKYIASIVFDNTNHFDIACEKGIIINGDRFVRFVGTAGGIKKNTILFVNECIYDELNKRADNGRNKNIKMVNAKFEAYKSLMFSSSIPVSMPKGIIIVKDCIMKFKEDTIFINDLGVRGGKIKEPTITEIKDMDIELNITDGFGLAKPSLMKRWTEEILQRNITDDEILGGACTRNAFEKGMVYTWNIDEWIEEYNNGNYIITDVWGNKQDLRKCELILTEGMLKLWSSYDNIEHYLNECVKNKYTFSICKTSENNIDTYRTLNYQYLQSFDLNDKDIDKLIMPTIKRIKDCVCGDYKTTLKYLGVKENNTKDDMKEFSFKEALALNKTLMNDDFIIKKINNMIKKEIDDTKIGKIVVKGNYQVASGDPFCLLQSMCGLEVTGVLKRNEFYSSFWDCKKVDEILIMRSPMTVHNNIVKGKIVHSELARKWFKYMKNIIVLNGWDNTMSAENGQDFDGDTNFTTDNQILLKNHKRMKTILCNEHTASKDYITEENLRKSNKNGFGNNVGTVTNRATSMYDIICTLEKNSDEYTIMHNRISSCQLLQQAVIDSSKTGFITMSMPAKWYTRSLCKTEVDLKLCCDKKPYFMKYIYKQLKREYNSWLKQWNDECYFDFGCNIKDLINKIPRTKEEEDFLVSAYGDMPVTDNNCLMNKICHRVENEFDGFVSEKIKTKSEFDYTILKFKNCTEDDSYDKYILEMIKDYNGACDYQIRNNTNNKDDNERDRISLINSYQKEVCSSEDKEKIINKLIDISYTYNKSGKTLLWDVFSEDIIDNLLEVTQ